MTGRCCSKGGESVFKAVCFDVDGVLTKIDSIWRYLHIKFNTLENAKKNAELFRAGKISYEEWAILDASLWKGISVKDIDACLSEIPLRENAVDLLRELKQRGVKLIAISAGLDIVIKEIEKRSGIKFDSSYANKLIFKNNVVSGDVEVFVEYYNKGEVLTKACKELRIDPSEVISIGDSEVDIPMMKKSGFSIAFNPKSIDVLISADIAIFSEKLLPLTKLLRLLC